MGFAQAESGTSDTAQNSAAAREEIDDCFMVNPLFDGRSEPQNLARVVSARSRSCQGIVIQTPAVAASLQIIVAIEPVVTTCRLQMMAPRFNRRWLGTAVAVLWFASPVIYAADAPTLVTVRALVVPQGLRTIRLWLAVFDESLFELRLIDNAGRGNMPRYETLAEAAEANDCAAGCNGGFFNRSPFDPVGLMISNGKRFGTFDPASWQQGIVVVRNGRASLETSGKFDPSSGVDEALQSGPWLVMAGHSEPNLDPQRQARRTFICRDDHGVWAIGACDVCSGPELAALLRHKIVTDVIDVQLALNLDGGPSTGLWVKREGAPFYIKEGWPVRNYLAVGLRRGPPKQAEKQTR